MSRAALLPVYPRLALELVEASGCYLKTRDGRRILDLYGGHAVTPLGHGDAELAQVIGEAFSRLDFFSNSLHMDAQQRAADALLADSEHLRYVHFTNSGTEANEAALHLARRQLKRDRIVSFECSFHGRTLASLAATGIDAYRARLSVPACAEHTTTIRYGDLDDLALIDRNVAAVICESVPSLAGVYLPPEGYYPALARRCEEVGSLLIFDEVQGGMGRLGSYFAHQRFGVRPNMVTLAKGIAGGYPAGALLLDARVGDAVETGELGTTFGGGPLACEMIAAVSRILRERGLIPRTEQIFAYLADALRGREDVELRGAGCLIGLQTPLLGRDLRDRLLDAGVLVGVSAEPQTVRLLPAYITEDEQLAHFVEALDAALR